MMGTVRPIAGARWNMPGNTTSAVQPSEFARGTPPKVHQ